VARDELNCVAGTNQQRGLVLEIPKDLPSQNDGSKRYRHGICADCGVRAHPFGDRKGVLKEAT
jgi:hypothetical protein